MSGAEKILLARMTLIRHRSAGGRPEDDGAIVRQFDLDGMAEFWDVVLSEPMEAEDFVLALGAHFMVIDCKPDATPEDMLVSGRAAKQAEGNVCAQLRTALRLARNDREPWFLDLPPQDKPADPAPTYRKVLIYSVVIGPPKPDYALVMPPDPPPYGVDLSRLKVRPRAAVEWLLAMPRRQHLVPPSLAAYLSNPASIDAVPVAPASAVAKTGAPGHPTSMHLILAERDARAARGETLSTKKDEAAALHSWFKSNHPSLPAPTDLTIRNRLSKTIK